MQEMQLTPDVALSAKNYGAYEVLQKMIPDLSDSEEDKQILGTLGVELLRKIDVSVTTDISIEYYNKGETVRKLGHETPCAQPIG